MIEERLRRWELDINFAEGNCGDVHMQRTDPGVQPC